MKAGIRGNRWALGLVLIGLAAGLAHGQEMANEPFDRFWDLEQGQGVYGKVVSIVEQTYPTDWQTHKLMEKPASTNKLTFQDGRLVTVAWVSPEGKERPDVQITYQNGVKQQIVRKVSLGRPNAEPEVKTATETATLKVTGGIESITVERVNGEKTTVPIKTQPTPDGGKTLSWTIQGPSGPRPGPATTQAGTTQAAPPSLTLVLTFDKTGHLIRREGLRDGQPFLSSTFTYNPQGDMDSMTMGPKSKMVYEREYDPRGNWTKMTRSMIRDVAGKEVKDIQEMKTRQVTYAP